jgi:hypothetical protein
VHKFTSNSFVLLLMPKWKQFLQTHVYNYQGSQCICIICKSLFFDWFVCIVCIFVNLSVIVCFSLHQSVFFRIFKFNVIHFYPLAILAKGYCHHNIVCLSVNHFFCPPYLPKYLQGAFLVLHTY